jgi:hypothetical protein
VIASHANEVGTVGGKVRPGSKTEPSSRRQGAGARPAVRQDDGVRRRGKCTAGAEARARGRRPRRRAAPTDLAVRGRPERLPPEVVVAPEHRHDFQGAHRKRRGPPRPPSIQAQMASSPVISSTAMYWRPPRCLTTLSRRSAPKPRPRSRRQGALLGRAG